MKYEVILFDADETLFDFKKSEREAFRKAMIDMGIEYDEDYHFKIYHEINTKIWREFEEGLITQEKLKVERFRRLADKLSIKLDEYEIAELYMNHLSEASFLYDESIELLEELKEKYKLIIITNGLTKVQDKRVRKSKIAKYFKDIIISEEVAISKPNAEIFHHALDKIGYHDKNKVLMVGDSLTSDIQGGINAGIDTCWYNPNEYINNTNIIPIKRLFRLIYISSPYILLSTVSSVETSSVKACSFSTSSEVTASLFFLSFK